jgi:hypothetical protein
MDGTSVTENDRHLILADLTAYRAVGDNHGELFSSSVNFSALIYPMSAEKASTLPESTPRDREKRCTLEAAPNQCFKTCVQESSDKVEHP